MNKKDISNYHIPDFVRESPNFEKLFLREIEIVKNANGKWGHKFEENEGIHFDYNTFFEAYYDLGRLSKIAIWFSDDIAVEIFDESTVQRFVGTDCEIGDHFFGERTKHGYRMFSRERYDDNVRQIENALKEWESLDNDFTEETFTIENLVKIHTWLDTHPEFWLEKVIDDNVMWTTEDGISSLSAFPFHVSAETGEYVDEYAPDKDSIVKEIRWRVEGGYHVIQDEYKGYCGTYYHDIALDGEGDTYDLALINFGKHVWLQGQGLLKEREEKRDAWLASLNDLQNEQELI